MEFMGEGLQKAAGSKMKNLLGVLTTNRFLGVLVGAGVTALIQSSSATTVMVVGFVNAGLMPHSCIHKCKLKLYHAKKKPYELIEDGLWRSGEVEKCPVV